MKAIDIRYNLEYVGFQEGMGNYTDEDKLDHLENMGKEEIMRRISGNGCPASLECTAKEFENDCSTDCISCWRQEV